MNWADEPTAADEVAALAIVVRNVSYEDEYDE